MAVQRTPPISLPFRDAVPAEAVVATLRRVLGDAPGRGWVRLVIEREVPAGGPGTELKRLLRRWLGIVATPDCPCNAHAAEMDRREAAEPGWCEANVETIVEWLRAEATRRGLPFADAAGRLLVRRAIANARRKAADR